jgi:hypothetical protein
MVEAATQTPVTLDDLLAMARDRPISVEVKLATRQIIEKVLLELGEIEQVESYLLSADFNFRMDNEPYRISIIYVQGYKAEPLEINGANRRIANFRLQRDYRRLQEAGIAVEEKYFEDFRI